MARQDGGGGGGGGDRWGWERTVRNVAPNLFMLGVYFVVTSYGGDGFGGGFFGETAQQPEWKSWQPSSA